MGLIKVAMNAASSVMADQWKEYFYCDAIPVNVLALKGKKRNSGRANRGGDNIISNGSVISIADGQCMMIVEQGKVVDVCAETGEYTYDMSTEPSLFFGDLSQTIIEVFKAIGKRFTFGGETPKDQRVYYFNTKELMGNKYGTPSPVPFRVVDKNIGLDIDIAVRCFGEYSYRITNPLLFYTNICGNVEREFTRDQIESQLKSELLTALQPAFARISDMGIRYSSLPGHTMELASALNEVLSDKWRDQRGVEIVSFGVSSVKASEEDEQMIKELQRNAAFRDPTMAGAHLVGAQAAAMQAAASNQNAGAVGAFMGMNMAGNAGGVNAQSLFQMGQQQAATVANGWDCPACGTRGVAGNFCPQCGGKKPAPTIPFDVTWDCPACGTKGVAGNFCPQCGGKKPETPTKESWTCTCGAVNTGKFCAECGSKKPEQEPEAAPAPRCRCNKCGWEPEDPASLPKFCPECGDPFDENDTI